MKKDNKTHAMLLALVGVYMLYIAYRLFAGLQSGEGNITGFLAIALIAFFALAGIGIFCYARKVWKAGPDETKKREDEPDHELK